MVPFTKLHLSLSNLVANGIKGLVSLSALSAVNAHESTFNGLLLPKVQTGKFIISRKKKTIIQYSDKNMNVYNKKN